MNYFNAITKWIEGPLEEFKIELAILNIDQARDIYSDRGELAKKFLDHYTAYWLNRVSNQIQKKNSLAKQADSDSIIEKEGYDFLKKLNAVFKLEKGLVDFVIAFISDRDEIEKNGFLKKVKTYCKTDNIFENLHSAQIMEYAGKSFQFEGRDNCTLVFPIHYDDKFLYDSLAVNYINDLTSLHLSSLKESKSKNFLIAFEFIKHFKKAEKKRFFRSVIRSFAQLHFDRHSINFENISFLLDSEEDVQIFSTAVSEIIRLLEYNSVGDDAGEFATDHPYFIDGNIEKDIKSDFDDTISESMKLKKNRGIDTSNLSEILLGEVKSTDPKFREELMTVHKILDKNKSILLLGETGVGKSYYAKNIHKASIRKDNPFIEINCASLPGNLIESELFGHVKGAFTGATVSKKGKLSLADKGVLFLDEIGKAPLEVQQKLLHVLDKKGFYPVGSDEKKEVDVRFIFASNDNLQELICEGKFLLEFYQRIANFPITIPPLRERPEDIEPFILFFKNEYEKEYDWKVDFTDSALSVLKSYSWPGNTREIEYIIDRLVVVYSDEKNEITEQNIKDVIATSIINIGQCDPNNLREIEKRLKDFFANWLEKKEEIVPLVREEIKRWKEGASINETSFGRSVIEPILAKIYKENYKQFNLTKDAASGTIGLTWSGTETSSTLPKKLKLYPIVEDFFK